MKLRTKKPGVLALAAAATMAVAGIGAGSAQASLLTACTGASPVHGEGSSLQGVAQGVWTTRFNTNTNGGCTVSGRTPRATYTATSSGRFMNGKWGADGVTAFDRTVTWGGTDDAPTSTQLSNMNTNTRSSVLSVPVAQAAIAILVNPPSGCTIGSITPSDLEKVFRGNITTWAGITGTSGCGTATITRVVRTDSSGTSFQLKHYLDLQHTAADICSATGRTTAAWGGVPITGTLQDPSNNTVWPSVCDGAASPFSPSTGVKYSQAGCPSACSGTNNGSGGGDEVKTVIATSGAIGYAALPDARAQYTGTNQYKWIPIRSGLSTIDPSSNGLSTTRANSNCTTSENSYGRPLPSGTSSWTDVYLTTPGTQYPICTLTWDLAVSNYSTLWAAGPPTGQAIATTVHDFFNYVNLRLGGQADIAGNDYAVLPNGARGTGDVQFAAETAIRSITD